MIATKPSREKNMSHKKTFTAVLIALGIISSASAVTTNEVHVTGSTAFRSNFFTAATATNGIFDAPGGTALNGATSGSGLVTYVGLIGGTPYALECSWTGSEAGIANVDGVGTLPNPGLPNDGFGAGNLPGATTTFPKIDGTSGGFTGAGDLTCADTSQNVSLTKPPAHSALFDYGVLGVVTFVWEKGVNTSTNSVDAGDIAWGRLLNVTQPQMLYALAATVNANFLTGNTNDSAIPVAMFGRNAGSGTRANTLLDVFFGIGNTVSQFALNSTYSGSGVLTYNASTNNTTAVNFPTVNSCKANSIDYTMTPNFVSVGNDGYESGAGVSYCLSCDSAGSDVITLGYLGLGDAKHARDGQPLAGAQPFQPGGAAFLTLDGVAYNDAAVVNGTYSFWGHEHLYGSPAHTTIIDNAASAIKTGVATAGGLGTGSTAAQNSGIVYAKMLCDKNAGGDSGYPAPGAPAHP
jgi:hypothetical protein